MRRSSSTAKTITAAAILLISADVTRADIFSYEGNSFPDQAGFVVGQNFCDPDQWVEDGCFFQFVNECPEFPPPGNAVDLSGHHFRG